MSMIAIVGMSYAGKSHLAKAMNNYYGYTTISFAAPLKRGVCAMFGLPSNTADTEEGKAAKVPGFDFTLRHALQKVGTEGVRDNLGMNVFAIIAMQEALKYRQAIFDDCRFPNEAQFARDNGAIIVKLITDEQLSKGQRQGPKHASEDISWCGSIFTPDIIILRIESTNALFILHEGKHIHNEPITQRKLYSLLHTNALQHAKAVTA